MATTRKTKTDAKKADTQKADTQKADTQKAVAPPDPDSLVRQTAGNYLSGDGRFEVRESDSNWFLIDTQQTNEFGQELLQGPFPSLKAVREKMPGARKAAPLPRSRTRAPRKAVAEKASPKTAAPATPPPSPPSWIDRLPARERSEARQLIRALEREGVADAEKIVRRDREGLEPIVARQLIERRLKTLVDELNAAERERARDLLNKVLGIISRDGGASRTPLPGWLLVETGPERDPPNRRIRLG